MSGRHNFIIAIDGFSSCGKSTLAKALAKKLKFAFIDSGAMYRAVTLYFIRHEIALDDQEAIENALNDIHIDFIPNAIKTEIHLNDEDISEEIRQMYISDKVSDVSAIKAVRVAMVASSKNWVAGEILLWMAVILVLPFFQMLI